MEEFQRVNKNMLQEENPRIKLFWYSAAYSILPRIYNFEYDPQLQFIHLMLMSLYQAVIQRLQAPISGDSTVKLPENYFDRLAQIVGELATSIENDVDTYPLLQKISNLAYLTTGNGYYMTLKGVNVAPD